LKQLGADGKTYYVSSDMKYKDWKNKYVDDAKTKSYHNLKQDEEQYEKSGRKTVPR